MKKYPERKLSYKDSDGNLYYFAKHDHDRDSWWLHDQYGKYLDKAPDKISLIWQWDLKHISPAKQTLKENLQPMKAKTVFEALANDDIKQEIAELKMKVMYAHAFHPEKVEIYLDRIAELEGILPPNTLQEDFYHEPQYQWRPLKPGDDQVNEFEKKINEEFPIITPEGREDWWFVDRVYSFPEASDGTAWFIICSNDNGKKHMSFRSEDLYNDVQQDGSLSAHETGSTQVWNNPGNDDYVEGEND